MSLRFTSGDEQCRLALSEPERLLLVDRRKKSANTVDHILDTAAGLIADHGIAVATRLIIDESGVSTAAFYCKLPSRRELVRALYDRESARLTAIVELAQSEGSGWDGLVSFIDGATSHLRERPATLAILREQARLDDYHRPGSAMSEPLGSMVAAAIVEGQIRPDAHGTDIALVPIMLSTLTSQAGIHAATVLDRQREIILAGLRSPQVPTQSLPGAALDVESYHQIAHSHQDSA